MILQITPTTDISMNIIQLFTVIGFIGAGAWHWFINNQRHKDHYREIQDLKAYNHLREEIFDKMFEKLEKQQNDKFEELTEQFDAKIDKLEEASKTFYKQLDAKTDKIENAMQDINKMLVEMSKQLAVHLAQGDIKHSK